MAYVGNTPFGPSCPAPTRVFAQVNTGFPSVRRSVGLAHDPTSQETPARGAGEQPPERGLGPALVGRPAGPPEPGLADPGRERRRRHRGWRFHGTCLLYTS